MAKQETDVEQNQSTGKKSNNFTIITVVILLAIAGGAYYYFSQGKDADQAMNSQNSGPVVATVNGTKLTRDEFDRNVNQLAGVYASQGVDTTNEQNIAAIRQEVLDTMINRQLIIEAATTEEVSVSTEEIENSFNEIVNNLGGQENLASALTSAGLDESTFRSNIETDLKLQKYVEGHANLNDIEVTEEEISSFYDSVKVNNPEVGELEEVAEAIKAQLTAQKQQEMIAEVLNELRAKADIQILI